MHPQDPQNTLDPRGFKMLFIPVMFSASLFLCHMILQKSMIWCSRNSSFYLVYGS